MTLLKLTIVVMCSVAILDISGCATAPETQAAKDVLHAKVREAVVVFKDRDPQIRRFFDTAYGYAVFPEVFKGAYWIGGAYGKGEVYEEGQRVGYSSLSQATLGLSFGGEFFRGIVFFPNKEEFDSFRSQEYTFAAQVTGVALTAGVAAKTDYKYGKAVFVIADRGLMVDASLGGQKFMYLPEPVAAGSQYELTTSKAHETPGPLH